MAAQKSQEVEKKFPSIPTETLAQVSSFNDAIALAEDIYGKDVIAVAADVLGDGFRIVEDKDTLIGVSFFALSWNFVVGDHGEYVIVRAITQDDQKLLITDGSTGIRDMLSHYSKQTGRYGGLFCRKGLRRSDYTYTNDKGEERDASTYYLDVSA